MHKEAFGRRFCKECYAFAANTDLQSKRRTRARACRVRNYRSPPPLPSCIAEPLSKKRKLLEIKQREREQQCLEKKRQQEKERREKERQQEQERREEQRREKRRQIEAVQRQTEQDRDDEAIPHQKALRAAVETLTGPVAVTYGVSAGQVMFSKLMRKWQAILGIGIMNEIIRCAAPNDAVRRFAMDNQPAIRAVIAKTAMRPTFVLSSTSKAYRDRVKQYNEIEVADTKVIELLRHGVFEPTDPAKRKRCASLLECFRCAMIECAGIEKQRSREKDTRAPGVYREQRECATSICEKVIVGENCKRKYKYKKKARGFEDSQRRLRSAVTVLKSGQMLFRDLYLNNKSVLGVGIMNEILRSASAEDAVKRFRMGDLQAVKAVLAVMGGEEAKCYIFTKKQLSGRVWNVSEDEWGVTWGVGLVGYVLDVHGAEVVRTMTTEQDPEAQARCNRISKQFKDAMISTIDECPDLE